MKSKEFNKFGIYTNEQKKLAGAFIKEAVSDGLTKEQYMSVLANIATNTKAYQNQPILEKLAKTFVELKSSIFIPRDKPAPFKMWGTNLDPNCIKQMENACQLPISVAGAMMSDSHVGYGIGIGGVLATNNAVIPYAVGMDIACRMKLSILDLPISTIRGKEGMIRNAIEKHTRFGIGAEFETALDHPVMDLDWNTNPITKMYKSKAWKQLGTSGSGNHFYEFGILTILERNFGELSGQYVAMLSHSGSRGTGANIATYYSKLAQSMHPELPKELTQLAWLDLNTEEGNAYWQAMELMGQYASAGHELMHKNVAKEIGANIIYNVENHHNFAWRERHFNQDVIVHRKGATPANIDALGVIPGSMATPGYVVRGKGDALSMNSASHGAGRAMSRTVTKNSITWCQAKKFLLEHDVILISAGLDEVPMAYKDIETVMAAQSDLVEVIARFDPKLVKMAPDGEKAED